MDHSPLPARRARSFRAKLARLREKRRQGRRAKQSARRALTPTQRESVLRKTGGRCHICGSKVGRKWQADHVTSHSLGGAHAEDNYLPAHALCNNYRRHYLPEEFHIIIKLGVWARTQVEKGTPIGEEIAQRFTVYERGRERRRVAL